MLQCERPNFQQLLCHIENMVTGIWFFITFACRAICVSAVQNITELSYVLDDPKWPTGLVFDQSCTNGHLEKLTPVIPIVNDMLESGLSAINSDPTLFEFFFQRGDQRLVRRAFGQLLRVIEATADISVMTDCGEDHSLCAVSTGNVAYMNLFRLFTAVNRRTPRNNLITICPRFFQDQAVETDPCAKESLAISPINSGLLISRPDVYLHELFHLGYLLGPGFPYLADIAITPYEAHYLTQPLKLAGNTFSEEEQAAFRPIRSVNNYVFLARWAWIKQQQQQKCPAAYPLWNAVELAQPPAQTDELKQLLGDNTTIETVTQDILDVTLSDATSVDEQATFQALNISGIPAHEASGMNFSAIALDSNSTQEPEIISWYGDTPTPP